MKKSMYKTPKKIKGVLFSLLLFTIYFISYPTLFAENKANTGNHNDSVSEELQHLDSLSISVTDYIKKYKSNPDYLLSVLDSIQQNAINKYGKESLINAFLLHKKGVVYYMIGIRGNNQQFNRAIDFFGKAIKIRLSQNQIPDEVIIPDIINGYNNIGWCYLKINQPYQAIENLILALGIVDKHPELRNLEELQYSLNTYCARTYSKIGDYDNALLYYSNNIHSKLQESDQENEDAIELWKIRAYNETGGIQAVILNSPESALKNLNQAKELLAKEKHIDEKILRANTFHNLGWTYGLMGAYETAIECFKKSISLNGEQDEMEGIADSYLQMGVLFTEMNEPDKAEYYLVKAGNLYSSMDAQFEWSYIYDNLGDVEYRRGNLIKSLDYDNLAIQYLLPDFYPKSVHSTPLLKDAEIPDKQGLLISITSKANTFLELYHQSKNFNHLISSYKHFVLADTVIGMIRSEFIPDASKMTIVELAKPVYEKAIQTCWKLYAINLEEKWFELAFTFSEKSRAIILLDAVRKSEANSTVPGHLIENERKYNLKLNYYEKQVALLKQQEEDSPYLINFLDSVLFYRRKHASVRNQIKKDFPDYHNLIYNQNTISVQEVKEFLDKDESLVEYFVGDEYVFTFLVNKDTMLFAKNELADSVKNWAGEFTFKIIQKDQQFVFPAYQLYKYLISSIEEETSLSFKLIIVPDGILSSTCFDALVTQKPDSGRIYFPEYQDYLLFDHQISYAFSASTLQETNKKTELHGRSLLGIAPSFQEGFSVDDTYFDKLVWNTSEVKDITRIFHGRKMLNNRASRNSFIEQASEYDLIHLATHAKANNIDGDLSFILFSHDGSEILYAKDLYALELHAEMVVLSACQTGVGPVNKGEGIISLARGFIYAGSSAVVSSLWSVKEKSNNEIILKFYRGIKSGLPKDQALREAKLGFIESVSRDNQGKAHPYYWGPLVVIGDTSPYKSKNSFSLTQITGILILIILLILLVKITITWYYSNRK